VLHQAFIDAGTSSKTAHTMQIYLDGPLKILFILVLAFILTRLVNRVAHRMVNGLRLVSPVVKATARGSARVQTLAGAFTQIFRALIWIIAFLEILHEFNIDLTPFVATATVVGAAVGFGAQTLVKDFLSGILLLAEDQFGVGDHIAIGTGTNITSGTVESVSLRVTRLRGSDGGILYIPNGDIRTLSNDTETDSQALVDIVVPLGTDLEAAGDAAQAAAQEMAIEPEWVNEFEGEPYFAGVSDATTGTGVTIRIMALTRPGQHLRLARELRLRIIERLREDGLAWTPSTVPTAPGSPHTAADPSEKTRSTPSRRTDPADGDGDADDGDADDGDADDGGADTGDRPGRGAAKATKDASKAAKSASPTKAAKAAAPAKKAIKRIARRRSDDEGS
jgi:small conductance mechanosensitive channel